MTYITKRTKGADGAPLVLTFHGTGGTEHQFHDLARALVPGAHVISPRGDVSEHGHARFFRRRGEGVYDMDDLAKRTLRMADYIEKSIGETSAHRCMALGYSNGANILASVMLYRPDLLDHVALMHPLIPWSPASQPELAGKRVLITAGRNDPICPPDKTESFYNYLKAQGAEVDLHWHDGGHEIRDSELEVMQAFFGEDAPEV